MNCVRVIDLMHGWTNTKFHFHLLIYREKTCIQHLTLVSSFLYDNMLGINFDFFIVAKSKITDAKERFESVMIFNGYYC